MTFEIENATGHSITLKGTTYASGAWVDLTPVIGFRELKFQRNDIDGTNAGRGLDGLMIRDRVATKGKWTIGLPGVCDADTVAAVMELVYPESFSIRTDFPTGTTKVYTCYANNIPVTYSFKTPSGREYFSGISIPIVEM